MIKNELFKDINEKELNQMLKCLDARTKEVSKDQIILRNGEKPKSIGIVLSGLLHIIKEDYDGNRTIMSTVGEGETFAEAVCCANVEESPVSVVARENSKIIILKFDKILHTCPNSCIYHQKLIENMLNIVANKAIALQNRMDIITQKSIRNRVLSYLETFKDKNITIPLNREEMANYLCVERSALSHELSKMAKEGIINYKKNKFILNM